MIYEASLIGKMLDFFVGSSNRFMDGVSTFAAPFEVVGPCASTEGEEMHWVWTFQWLDLDIFLRIDSIAQLVTCIKKPSLFFPFQDMTKKMLPRQGRD